MPLNPPEYGRVVVFGNSPLKTVLCQLRFPPILSMARQEFVAEFQEGLRDRYPLVGQMHETAIAVGGVGAASPPQVTSSWQFTDTDETWTVTLSVDALALETTAYANFADFSQRFNDLVGHTINRFSPTRQNRIGLRYINEIVHPDAGTPAAWQPFLRAELLGVVGGEVVGEDVIQSMEQIRVQQPDGIFVLRHGFVKRSSTPPEGVYILDFDYFDEQPQPLDAGGLAARLENYNDTIYRVFRWSIEPQLYQFFEPQGDNE